MAPWSRRLPARILIILAAGACVWAAGTLPRAARAEDKPKGQPVTVMVSGQGTPVPGVKITLAPDHGGTPESWNVGTSTPLAVIPTDATGHAVFPDVAPGMYIVTTSCGLPGDWIAGNYATRIEVLASRPSAVTLTLRRGGMVRGKATQGGVVAGHAEIRSDSPDALMSACGMMTPSLVDTTTGAFTVSKMPLNATTWVKGELPFGPGRLGVWKDFHFEKPDTVDLAIDFPAMGPKDVGSLVLDLKADTAEKPDSGVAQLLQLAPTGKWRYEANVDIGGVNGATTIPSLPAGPYQIRGYATPGSSKWWNAPIDSFTIEPGKTAKYTLKISIRS
jgi:hypothetical protein